MPTLNEIKGYKLPKLHTGKEWYIGFYAFNPANGTMQRKKIKLNHIKSIKSRRLYADGYIKRLSEQLSLFQFHKVQLKANNSYNINRCVGGFNSIRYN